MELFYDILLHTLSAILTVAEVGLFLRAILSWFDPMEESRIASFLYLVTEPLIYPIRRLFEAKRWMEGSPIDVPFLITVLVIAVLRGLLVLF